MLARDYNMGLAQAWNEPTGMHLQQACSLTLRDWPMEGVAVEREKGKLYWALKGARP